MTVTTAQTVEFETHITTLAESAHGVAGLETVKVFMTALKSEVRLQIIERFLLRPPATWTEVKDHVWSAEDKRIENKFPFLQGDIIETTLVEKIGASRSGPSHDLWLVLSPDCDCVRAPLLTVAPIFCGNPEAHDVETLKDHKQRFKSSLAFGTHKFFPLKAKLFENSCENYYADLTEPYFLRKPNQDAATVHFSMRKHGWHLLNALVKHRDSRSQDRVEAEKIRDHGMMQAPRTTGVDQ